MVDRVLVERILFQIDGYLKELRNADDIDWKKYQKDNRSRRFVERLLHVVIEACIDVCQHIIVDEGLRAPESYRDTFRVLAEKGIIPGEKLEIFERIAGFRNLIVHHYEKIDDEVVFGIFKKRLGDFDDFIDYITKYIANQANGANS